MSRSTVATLAPRSIDLVRVVRRCMRCFVFGAIGLLPVVGVGLAVQALRWGRVVSAEVGGGWTARGVYCSWIVGLIAMGAVDRVWGFVADVAVCVLTLGAQSYLLWGGFSFGRERVWNPAERQLFWGVTFAYAGLAMSIWLLGILLCRLTSALGSL